jgi:hypothetical protein
MIRVTRMYEENVNLGNYQSARFSATLSSDRDCPDMASVTATSEALIEAAKKLVAKDIEKLKLERAKKVPEEKES